jgi:hypothetical protein
MIEWILIILCHLVFFAVCCGCGLLIVVLIESAFEQITGRYRTEPKPSQAQLEKEFEKIENKELEYEFRLLLDERRMLEWWKLLVLFIVAGTTYAVMLLRTFYS